MLSVNGKRSFRYEIRKTSDVFAVSNGELLNNTPLTRNGRAYLIVDENVFLIYGEKIKGFFNSNSVECGISIVESGDGNKNIDAFRRVFADVCDFDLNRCGNPIIGIGGGVATDIGGLVAATYRRGVPHINIPTTLMGYIDASIGIKNGVNFERHKNRLGTFYPPKVIMLDRLFLNSVSQYSIKEGVGEIIKMALIADSDLFDFLEKHGAGAIDNCFQCPHSDWILDRSICGIVAELEPNLFEENLERKVDFGHTYSLVMEGRSSYSIGHGYAVAADCFFSCCLSAHRGLLSFGQLRRVHGLYRNLDIPIYHPTMSVSNLIEGLNERVMHRGGRQNCPVPVEIGCCKFLNDVSSADIASALELVMRFDKSETRMVGLS